MCLYRAGGDARGSFGALAGLKRSAGLCVVTRITICLLAGAATSCATSPALPLATPVSAQVRRVPVELWRRGDDGYTGRFAWSLERALKASGVFLPVIADDRAIRLTLDGNLQPLERGDNPNAEYVVALNAADGSQLGAISGRCRGSEFNKCARAVITWAERLLVARDRLPRR